MKNKFLYIVMIAMSFILVGCGRELYETQLPDNYILFDNFGFESKQVEEDVSAAFEYNGRTYYFYTYCRYLYEDDVNKALGRLVSDGKEDDSYVIVSLSYNDSDDYLVAHYEGNRFMAPQDEVYRAIDTRNKKIETPDYITPPSYFEKYGEGDRMAQYWLRGKE